jgi:hypothetical protein
VPLWALAIRGANAVPVRTWGNPGPSTNFDFTFLDSSSRSEKFVKVLYLPGPFRTLALDGSDEVGRTAPSESVLRLGDAGSQIAGGPHERLVALRPLAPRSEKRVLQADTSV